VVATALAPAVFVPSARDRATAFVAAFAIVALAAACNPDLNVTNPNNPDVGRAISTPGDVRNLIGNSYNGAYLAMQGNARPYPGIATGVMADVMDVLQKTQTLRFNLMTELEK